ncbi:MAG: GAF domain-containing protein [Verrucomicrobia bacterium]|nr:GAF domain-containing protein [Cytophagales bacterium]
MENQTILLKIKEQGDRVIQISLISYFIFGVALAFVYDTFLIAFGVGGICVGAFFLVKWLSPTTALYQYVASALFAVFTAQFIYQMHGLFEMHFFVFVGAALLIAYQNWLLHLPNIIMVVLHHGTFAYLQYAGNKKIYFTQLAYMDLSTFMIHGGLAGLIVAICGYWSYVFRKQTLDDAKKADSLNTQLTNVSQNIAFAEEVSQGNLVFEYQLADEKDELGKALLKMRENLLESQKREQQERFTTEGVAHIGEILRMHNQDMASMADLVVKSIVKYIHANQAGLFLLEDDNQTPVLNLKACYAYDRKKFITKQIAIGEGLIGQCFLEKEIIYTTQIPDNYIKITSGLGQSNPTCLVLVPIKSEEKVVGVLEIASFHPLETKEFTFLEKISESLASVIMTANINEKTKELLEASQQNTEVMKAQEEEMRQNMEELQAIQEEVSRKVKDYERLLVEKENEIFRLKNLIEA